MDHGMRLGVGASQVYLVDKYLPVASLITPNMLIRDL